MPLLLRKIDRRRWDWTDQTLPWLPAGEFPASPVADLCTDPQCSLSVWAIEEDRSNLERVASAFAASRDHLDKLDFVLFHPYILIAIGIEPEHTNGKSPDDEVNRIWHRDLVRLTSAKIIALAKLVHEEHADFGRFEEPELKALITSGIKAGIIDKKKVSPKIRTTLGA